MTTDFNLSDIDFSFDLGELDTETQESEDAPQFARVKRFKRPRVCKYEYAEKLAEDIGDIEEGDSVFCIVSGNFIAGDFIEAYLQKNKLVATEILISTLSLSSNNVDSLKNIFEHYSSDDFRMGLVVSDFFFSHERRKEGGINDIIETLGDYNFTLAVAGIHTKITLIKTVCGKHIVISGSANLRSSLNVEQITIDNSKTLYDFNRKWIADILNDYQATHKFLRRGNLWQLVANQGEQKRLEKENTELQN